MAVSGSCAGQVDFKPGSQILDDLTSKDVRYALCRQRSARTNKARANNCSPEWTGEAKQPSPHFLESKASSLSSKLARFFLERVCGI